MKTILLVCALSVLCIGCTTTGQSRREAAELSAKVAAYRDKQQERIEKLNRDYQRTFSRMMDELKDLHGQSLRQQFQLDAMNIADQMVLKWEEQTQPRRFRDTLQKSVNEQLVRMVQADAALAAARTTYAESYRDAVLQLKQLDSAKATLDSLATTPSQRKEVADLLRAFYKAYREVEKTDEKKKES